MDGTNTKYQEMATEINKHLVHYVRDHESDCGCPCARSSAVLMLETVADTLTKYDPSFSKTDFMEQCGLKFFAGGWQ